MGEVISHSGALLLYYKPSSLFSFFKKISRQPVEQALYLRPTSAGEYIINKRYGGMRVLFRLLFCNVGSVRAVILHV